VEHVVFFPAPDGTPAFRRFAGLEEAVRFVEHLRNVENVSSASVYSLTEVPLAFKAWYRVELPGESAEQPNGSAEAAPAPAATPVAANAAAQGAAVGGPATIAEAIESYSLAEAPGVPSFEMPGEAPEQGSSTGIVVPDQPLVAVDQFAMPPASALPVPTVLPTSDQPAPAPAAVSPDSDAQVLEPVFGAKRERGIGFFAR
jgi:hypothetical protein